MTWKTLQTNAEKLGYQIALRTRYSDEGELMPDVTPPNDQGWVLVGSYDHLASFWVKPLANGKVKLSSNLVRRLMAECDPFVETAAVYDMDLLHVQASYLAAMANLEKNSDIA